MSRDRTAVNASGAPAGPANTPHLVGARRSGQRAGPVPEGHGKPLSWEFSVRLTVSPDFQGGAAPFAPVGVLQAESQCPDPASRVDDR